MRAERGILLSIVFAMLACSDNSSHPPAPTPIDLAFGTEGAHASFDPTTGAFAITSPWRASLVGSSGALLGVVLDPDAPDGFHDPETTDEGGFVPLDRLVVDASTATRATLHGSIPGGGALSLTLEARGEGLAIDATTTGAPVALIELRLSADDGAYLGLGERFDHVDAKGTIVPLSFHLGQKDDGTNDAHVPIPAVTNTHGYGLVVATGEAGAADVAAGDPTRVRLVFEGKELHATLVAHRSPIDVVAALTRSMGLPRLPPLWSFAPMQWRNEGVDTQKVTDDLATTRALDIPGGCIWIDNPWQASYDDSTFDPVAFADPAAMIAQAKALGFETMVWSTPYLEEAKGAPADLSQQLYVEARAARYLILGGDGLLFDAPSDVSRPVPDAMVDLVNPAARAWWTSKVGAATSLGVAGFKLDFGEDLVPSFLGARLDLVLDGQPLRAKRIEYPLDYHRAYRDAVAAHGTEEPFILGRASALGGQAEVDAIWPGDLDDDLSVATSTVVGGLPASIVAMQSLASSGFPHYAADTGGFRGGRPEKEVFTRWAEVNALSMIFQNGGGGPSHAPWTYDDATVASFRALARRSMDLVPYRRALAIAASRDGTPTVRSLALAFPDEAIAIGAHLDDEYLLGGDVLLAPILTAGATSREVYVPSGAWVRWSIGASPRVRVVGPTTATLDAPLGDPIFLVREGAVLPLLAADVDTLGAATDPTVVTAAMRVDVRRAYGAIASGTSAKASFEDGATISVDAGAIDFEAPSGALTITLDYTADPPPSSWTLAGAEIARASSEAAASSCSDACVFVDPSSTRATLHLPTHDVVTTR